MATIRELVTTQHGAIVLYLKSENIVDRRATLPKYISKKTAMKMH